MEMELNEALEKLEKAGLICEADDYRQKVVNKLAGIVDRCYDLDDKGHSYANDIVSHWEKHIAEMEAKGVDANETAEVLWYVSKHNNLQSQPLYYTYQFYTKHDPDYFKEWTGLNEVAVPTPTRREDDGPIIFNDLSSLQQACSDAAITKHEYAQYDEFEQEPWCSTQEIREIPMEEFGQAVGADKFVGRELSEDEWENLVYDWFSWLCKNDFMGWDYIWNK